MVKISAGCMAGVICTPESAQLRLLHCSNRRHHALASCSGASTTLPRLHISWQAQRSRCSRNGARGVVCSASAIPARAEGRSTYKPPSFAVLIQDASNAILAAIGDGFNRLEVEFPVLPEDQDGEPSPFTCAGAIVALCSSSATPEISKHLNSTCVAE